jgi:hypothetical protein
MYTPVMLDRQNNSKLVYLEVDEVTKEVLHIISSYGLENWKKEKATKKLPAAILISKGEDRRVKTLYHQSENHKQFYSMCMAFCFTARNTYLDEQKGLKLSHFNKI